MPLLASLVALDARLRRLPADNPAYASDALLVAADDLAEAARSFRLVISSLDTTEASLAAAVALRLEARAEGLRRLAPIFAPIPSDRSMSA